MPLPHGLEAVILRAMAHEPEQRFESMRALAIALIPYGSESAREYWELELGVASRSKSSKSGEVLLPVATRYASWSMRSQSKVGPALVSEAETEELAVLRALDAGALELEHLAEGVSRPAELLDVGALQRLAAGSSSRPRESSDFYRFDQPPTAAALALSAAEVDEQAPDASIAPTAMVTVTATATKGRRWKWLTVGALAATASLSVGGVWAVRRWANESGSARLVQADPANDIAGFVPAALGFEVDVRATPESAALELDGVPVAVGRYQARFAQDGRQHELRVHADGFAPESVLFRDAPPPARLTLAALQLHAANESKPAVAGRAPASLSPAQARSLAARRKALTAALQADANHSTGASAGVDLEQLVPPSPP